MDLDLARTFLAVVRSGNFIGAADQLNVTQSTVSFRIRRLEDLIGQPLFERSKAGAALTTAGEQFQRHAIALVRVWEHARLDVALSEEHRDHLAVGGQISLWDGFLLRWLSLLHETQPDIAVTGRMGNSIDLTEQLIQGTLDIAIIYRPTQRPGIVLDHLFNEELVLVTSCSPVPGKLDDGYIFVNWGPEFSADHALAFPDKNRPSLHLDLGAMAIQYLLAQPATGYFPLRVANRHIEEEKLALVEGAPRFIYPAYAIYPEEWDESAFGPILKLLHQSVASIHSLQSGQ